MIHAEGHGLGALVIVFRFSERPRSKWDDHLRTSINLCEPLPTSRLCQLLPTSANHFSVNLAQPLVYQPASTFGRRPLTTSARCKLLPASGSVNPCQPQPASASLRETLPEFPTPCQPPRTKTNLCQPVPSRRFPSSYLPVRPSYFLAQNLGPEPGGRARPRVNHALLKNLSQLVRLRGPQPIL